MPTVTGEVEVSLDFEIWCEDCGAGLCDTVSEGKYGRGFQLPPCQRCMDEHGTEKYNVGYEEGLEEAKDSEEP